MSGLQGPPLQLRRQAAAEDGVTGRGSLPATPPDQSAKSDAGGGTGSPCAGRAPSPATLRRAGMGAIRADQFQTRQCRHGRQLDHLPCADHVVQAGSVTVYREDQARRVHQDVSRAPERLPGCIEASTKSATPVGRVVRKSMTAAEGSRSRPSLLRNRSCMRQSVTSLCQRVDCECPSVLSAKLCVALWDNVPH
jgi:hypothetical protein